MASNHFRKFSMLAIMAALATSGMAQKLTPSEQRVSDVLSQLTLEEKVALCSGDNGRFKGIKRLGIPNVALSDGPRGPHGGDRTTAFPCGVGMASTWNPELMMRAGQVMGEESRSLGYSVLLGPACNILRDPCGGRFFEYYSEDPYLNAEITVPVVQGIQSRDVSVSLKHYALNNREGNRNFYYSIVDDRTMHEIYLPAFKAAVQRGHAWTIMTSANGANYEYVSDSRKMLTDILKNKWGFDGFVITDWLQTRSTEKAAWAGLDVSMPGGDNCGFGTALLNAVKAGKVSEATIDDKARRVLRIYERIGMLNPDNDIKRGYKRNTPEHQAVVREVAEELVTLMKNERNVLPLKPEKVKNILVTGPNATYRNCQWAMGGSSWVESPYEVTVLDGLKKVYGDAKITYLSTDQMGGFQSIPESALQEKDGVKGFRARYFVKGKNEPAVTRTEKKVEFMWEMKSPDASIPVDEWREARFEGTIIPPVSGKYTFRFTAGGGTAMAFNGEWGGAPIMVADPGRGQGTTTGSVDLIKGQPYTLCVIYSKGKGDAAMRIEWETPESSNNEAAWRNMEKLARKADAVIFVGGLDMNLDTEGRDRSSLTFPALQQEMINRLARANKRTIVTLVNGSPLEVGGWLPNVPAFVEAWYPGMEGGTAVADVISGRTNPSGRLTFTWPKKLEDVPMQKLAYQDNDVILYSDSLNVGYRYYDTKGVEPEFPFGYGLSYSKLSYTDMQASVAGTDSVAGKVTVTNSSNIAAREVVQVYVRPVNPSVERPVHELKWFAKVDVPANGSTTVDFQLPASAFSYYDVTRGDWTVDRCDYVIEVGSDSRTILQSKQISLK